MKFPRPNNKTTQVRSSGARESIELVMQLIREHSHQVDDAAHSIGPKKSFASKCKAVWDFAYKILSINPQKENIIKSPARVWQDRSKSPGESIETSLVFVGSLLHRLNVPFKIRLAAYEKNQDFRNAYIVAGTGNDFIVLDLTSGKYNFEHPGAIRTKDISF